MDGASEQASWKILVNPSENGVSRDFWGLYDSLIGVRFEWFRSFKFSSICLKKIGNVNVHSVFSSLLKLQWHTDKNFYSFGFCHFLVSVQEQ